MARRRERHTLEQLLELRLGDAGGAAELRHRDDAAGRADYRIAPIVCSRSIRLRVSPAQAVIEEVPVDAMAIMSMGIDPGGDARKTETRNAIKSRFGLSSNAQADRCAYEVMRRLLDID